MDGFGNNLLLLYKNGFTTGKDYEQEVASISRMLRAAWSAENFCKVTELADHYRITRKPHRILREAAHYQLRPFRFLVNLN